MRPQVQGQHLILHLVINPGFDDVLGEDIVLQQEGVIFFQGHQRLAQFLPLLGGLRRLDRVNRVGFHRDDLIVVRAVDDANNPIDLRGGFEIDFNVDIGDLEGGDVIVSLEDTQPIIDFLCRKLMDNKILLEQHKNKKAQNAKENNEKG